MAMTFIRDFVRLCINQTPFNRVEITDFQSVCQEKGGVNSGGTSFLLKVGLLLLLFLILTMTLEAKLKTSELITKSNLFRFVPKIDLQCVLA